MTTTRVAEASCNGTDYSNCDVSTTATSTYGSDTESTTSADTDVSSTPTSTATDNNVDLINPLPGDCNYYNLTLGAGPIRPPAPPPPPAAAGAATAPVPPSPSAGLQGQGL